MLASLLKSFRPSARHSPREAVMPFDRQLAKAVSAGLHAEEQDNFDHARWPGGPASAYAREANWCRQGLKDLLVNRQFYGATHELLADAASQDWLVRLIAYRLLGHRHVRLPTNCAQHWEVRERIEAMPRGASPFSGMFGPLGRYELEFEGEPLVLDAWWLNVAWTYFFRQYYLARGPIAVQPRAGDRVIDGGSCFGDTALAFAASVGPAGRVLSFEIDPANLAVARHNFAANPALQGRLDLREAALAASSATALYRHGSGPGARIDATPSEHPVPVTTIDKLVEAGDLDRVDFIKMDIEGAELLALQGAERVLRRFRPRLAISLYHAPDHLWRIPLWIDSLGLGYRFHLDHYTIHHEETVLYASAARQ